MRKVNGTKSLFFEKITILMNLAILQREKENINYLN